MRYILMERTKFVIEIKVTRGKWELREHRRLVPVLATPVHDTQLTLLVCVCLCPLPLSPSHTYQNNSQLHLFI